VLFTVARTADGDNRWESAKGRKLIRTLAYRYPHEIHRFALGSAHTVGIHMSEPQVRVAETRLLYENASTGVAITLVIAVLLAYAEWDDAAAPAVVVAWLAYMIAVSVARLALARRYWNASPPDATNTGWTAAFVLGTTLASAGWGAGVIALYDSSLPMNDVLVVFVIGGVMLGSASLLAARPEAFLAFLLPAGLVTSWRVASQGDEQHLIMGFLGLLFTAATIVTTWRFHLAIESSFRLRFANEDLVGSLQQAKDSADAINRDLELRVHDRTLKLLEADQRKDQFLATLAHELRNPLAPIRFALETLKRDAPPATKARAHEVIERQVGQLVCLVDDLLDVSRITSNKIRLRHESLDLARVMETAIESVTPFAAASGHTLAVKMPAEPIWVEGDAVRLVQVFGNVLNNALKFTPAGGQIQFTAEHWGDAVVVRIQDTGVGIAPEKLTRVFDMFHQTDPSLDRSAGGLGIGLTLAQRLVQMHHGEIEVRSPGVGKGTEVEIRLPISKAPGVPAVAHEIPAPAVTRCLRALIVEDNADAAEMMNVAVMHLGHLTRVAHDGASAIAAAKEFAPDVVFLDLGLPGISGYEVARALRSEFSHVHIAAVTGWGQDEDRRKAREAGCDAHFTKPLDPARLEALLAAVANGDLGIRARS
jgi:signal transduction histidine kinase/ActR/RegA family two-component response regulator